MAQNTLINARVLTLGTYLPYLSQVMNPDAADVGQTRIVALT